ncbi:MAG: hypothetical protein ACREA2_00595 [Blastocatellia bacterium]
MWIIYLLTFSFIALVDVAITSRGLERKNMGHSIEPTTTLMENHSMHTVWLVKDVNLFAEKVFSDYFTPSSDSDRALQVSLSYEEWYSIWFELIGVSLDDYQAWAQNFKQGKTQESFSIQGYQMLSRICDNLVDADYSNDEVESLRRECLDLLSQSTEETATRGLRNLLFICDEAQRSKLGIYFICN